MKMPLHRIVFVLGIAVLALTLTSNAAMAEDESGIASPTEVETPRPGKAQASKPAPKTVDYGPGYGMRHQAMRNAPMGPATAHRSNVTPYGDFCPLCTNYGIGRKSVAIDHALEALKDYFARRGLEIRNLKGVGRFLKADVFKEGQLVDKILFDRRTGRIRSIY